MAGLKTYAHPTHANTQEYCCGTHVDHVLHTRRELCAHRCTYTAVTMLSAQRISSAVYTLAFTCAGRDLYRRSAGERWGSMCRRFEHVRIHHPHVMEGICTAEALEEGEVVYQVRTRTRILHTLTHRSTAALHMYSVCTTQRRRSLERAKRLYRADTDSTRPR